VSLLMDALKKAEEAKRRSEAAAKIEPQEATPATPAAPAAAGVGERGLPELPSRLELLDHEFQTPPAPKPTSDTAPAEPPPARPAPPAAESLQRERAAAQNVFQAKQPAQNRNLLIVGGLAVLLAVVGIGGWVWWEMQPKGGLAAAPATARTAPPPPAPIAAAPITPAPTAAPARPAAAEPAAEPATMATQGTEGAEGTAGADPNKAAVPPRLTFAERAPARRPAAAAPAAAAPPAESPIRITTARLKVHPQVASAYAAFQSGDYATAERDYLAVLRHEPKNTDALHGLAAISLRQGRPETAETLYFRILEADPKDSAAQAGLIGLRGQGDPMQSESRLKNLLAGQPDSPSLHFALGNLYARQGRWNEAQQAYFNAYSADGENPDYQFNLAVSLEQLRQPGLALKYYQGALAAAARRPAAFDPNQVAGRVSELQK
jgi:tetratricopeptide (TPR) repeat protein